MTRNHDEHPAAEVAAQDDDQTRHGVADSEIVPDDLAAAAVALREAGKDAGEQAIRCRTEAESVVSASRAEADRVISDGHAKALPLIADATALERNATELGGRSKHLEHAARQEALAEEHEAKTAGLSAEREHLIGVIIAGLNSRLGQLAEDRQRIEAGLAKARNAAAVRRIASLKSQLEATGEAVTALTGQRASAQARVDQIGDGTQTWTGELLDALTAAQAHRTALTKALDELYPDRPGAELRRDLVNLKNVLGANLERMAEEAKPEQAGRRRHGYAGAR